MIAAVVVVSLVDSVVFASLQRFVTFHEKVDVAAAIFVGRCTAKRSRWDAAHRWIVTDTTFRVEKTFKSSLPPEFTLILPDGDVGAMHQRTSGIPVFVTGRDYVVFVKNTSVGPTVLYFSQGVYHVTTDEHGERIVMPSPSNVTIRTEDGRGVVESEEPRSITDFESVIREVLEEPRPTMATVPGRVPNNFRAFVMRNKTLLALALLGAGIATWQFLRRT